VASVAAVHRPSVGESARFIGAASLVGVGVVHAQQYYGAYFDSVPTIGTLFLLNFVGAGLLSIVLLAPLRRWAGRRGGLVLTLSAIGGIGIAAGSLVALLASEYTPVFGFMESGYRLAIVLSLVTDGLAALFLGLFVVIGGRY
jgi:hypothetical protein